MVTVGLMHLLQQTRLCLFTMNRHNPSKRHDCSPNRHDPSKLHDCSPNRHDPPKLHDCTEKSLAGLYKDHTFSHFIIYKFYIYSFISFHTRERDRVLQTVRFDSQQTKCFLIVGRSFHPGRQIAKDSKHHREGNNCLKEIVCENDSCESQCPEQKTPHQGPSYQSSLTTSALSHAVNQGHCLQAGYHPHRV